MDKRFKVTQSDEHAVIKALLDYLDLDAIFECDSMSDGTDQWFLRLTRKKPTALGEVK